MSERLSSTGGAVGTDPGPAALALRPVEESDRIVAIDVLRGVAVLGILVMNIQSFASIGAAYMNPTAYGDLTGANRIIWLVSHLLTDQKFMSIFSMLFGAGIVLMSQRAEAAGRRAGAVHYRRMAWLLVFGLLHAHLLWFGDILYSYAICGMVIYPMRRWRSGVLMTLAVVAFLVPIGMSVMGRWSMQFWPPEAIEQQVSQWAPDADAIARELAIYRGGWLGQMTHRVPTAMVFQTMIFIMWAFWRASAMMLLGMVLFRCGVLTGRASSRVYAVMIAGGLAIGLGLTGFGVTRHFDAGWTLDYSMFLGSQFNYVGSVFGSLAWIGAVMLAYRALAGGPVARILAAVGRTALSCYLLETIICTTLFYGHGFGLFGRVDRVGQLAVVLAVWGFLLAVAPAWLRHFRYGPFEWLWRSLSYARLQPLRR